MVHGFTGSPFEMRPLGEWLSARGWAVEGPCLLGHGGTTRDLAATRWPDWLGSVESAVERLEAHVGQGRVAVVGLSLGGALTLELARRRLATGSPLPTIAALAPALWLSPGAMRFEDLVHRHLGALVRAFTFRAALPKISGSDLSDVAMRKANGIAQGTAGMPLAALHSLVELGQSLRPRLGEITTPTLLVHSPHDHTIPYACSTFAHSHLGGPSRLVTLDKSHHVITLDVERDRVFTEVGRHLDAYLPK